MSVPHNRPEDCPNWRDGSTHPCGCLTNAEYDDDERTRTGIIDRLKDRYHDRIMHILQVVQKACEQCGMSAEMYGHDNMSGEHRWGLFVMPSGATYDDGVDVTITLLESQANDGSEEGINFGLDIVSTGGHVIGGYVPNNYTSAIWVDPKRQDAVESRFQMIEPLDADGTAKSILDWWNSYHQPKRFFRTRLFVEILSETEPVNNLSLLQIGEAIETGDCSGRIIEEHVMEVDPKAMAKMLIAQGSDPEFFGLEDEDGTGHDFIACPICDRSFITQEYHSIHNFHEVGSDGVVHYNALFKEQLNPRYLCVTRCPEHGPATDLGFVFDQGVLKRKPKS